MKYRIAPNFVDTLERPFVFFEATKSYAWWYLGFIAAFLFTIETLPLVALAIFVFFLLPLFSRHPEWGMYTLAVLAPLIGWEIAFWEYEQTRSTVLGGINAPVADFMVISLLGTTLWAWITRRLSISPKRLAWMGILSVSYGVFALSSLWSYLDPVRTDILPQLRYWVRPLVFVYIGYVLLPIVLIQTKETLLRVLYILFWTAIIVAGMGLLASILLYDGGSWFRVVPFQYNGFAPLGYNHTALAAFVALGVPIGTYFAAYKDRYSQYHTGLLYVTMFLISIVLLTLSRAGWIVLFLGVIGTGYIFYTDRTVRQFLEKHTRTLLGISVLVLLLVGYMTIFLGSNVVQSSNFARIEQSRIAAYYWLQAPWFGYGPGSFLPMQEQTIFIEKWFGTPLEAHGLVLKFLFEYGIVGMFLFGLFLCLLWGRALQVATGLRRTDRILLSILVLVSVQAVVFQLFDTSYFNAHMWLPIGLLATGIITLSTPE